MNIVMTPEQVDQIKSKRAGWCRRNWGRFSQSQRGELIQLAGSPVLFRLLSVVIHDSLPELIDPLQALNPTYDFTNIPYRGAARI